MMRSRIVLVLLLFASSNVPSQNLVSCSSPALSSPNTSLETAKMRSERNQSAAVRHLRAKPKDSAFSPPPSAILICGLKDHPCVSYTVSFHDPTWKFRDCPGEGVTKFDSKVIAIARSNDRYENVMALQHEVYHAALFERGFDDHATWDVHSWIYFSEGAYSMLLHDNPDFVSYILYGY